MRQRKSRKKIVIILIIIVVLWLAMFLTDFYRAKHKLDPIFCYTKEVYMDGGTHEAFGLGYKVFVYKYMPGKIITCEVVSYFSKFDPSKYDKEGREAWKQFWEERQSDEKIN